MPLVRIDVPSSTELSERSKIAEIIHDAMVATLNVPKDDKFQIIAVHNDENLIADPNYLGISRSSRSVFVQITLNSGRTVEMKQAFYASVAGPIAEATTIRKEDVLINLIEVTKENWSFGNGEAQYA